MEWETPFKVISASLISIGGGGSNRVCHVFLGSVKFGLIAYFNKQTHKLNTELEHTKNSLSAELEKSKQELDILKETTLRFQNDKILTISCC